jgi:hypothetical protein
MIQTKPGISADVAAAVDGHSPLLCANAAGHLNSAKFVSRPPTDSRHCYSSLDGPSSEAGRSTVEWQVEAAQGPLLARRVRLRALPSPVSPQGVARPVPQSTRIGLPKSSTDQAAPHRKSGMVASDFGSARAPATVPKQAGDSEAADSDSDTVRAPAAAARGCASVLHCSIAGLTTIRAQMPAARVAALLLRLYARFDRLAAVHGVQTVGLGHGQNIHIAEYYGCRTLRTTTTWSGEQ